MASYGPKVFPAQPVTTTYAGTFPGSSLIPGGFSFLGDAITPADNLYPGSGTFPGQGNFPLIEVLHSTSDAATDPPVWAHIGDKARSFSISRGRNSELDEVDAGTASIVLDNRERDFDPTQVTTIRTRNRIWLRNSFSGIYEDMFHGYLDSIDQQWPGGGVDAVAVVSAVDEFSRLSRRKLPTTSPPRDTYADVVAFDQPAAYWRMNDDPHTLAAAPVVGPQLQASGGLGSATLGAIVGENPNPYSALFLDASDTLGVTVEAPSELDPTNLAEFAIEFWVYPDDVPSSNSYLAIGPLCNSTTSWFVGLDTTMAVRVLALNQAGTNFDISGGTLAVDTWAHIVATIESGSLRLYVNGAQVASTAWSGTFHGTLTASPFELNGNFRRGYDEVAYYRMGLPSARVAAHHEAGAQRGFARSQTAGVRAGAVLDTVSSHAPRQLQAGTRTMTAAYMRGQAPLQELRQAARAELPNGLLFVSRSGEIVLQENGHREGQPQNPPPIFGDAGGSEISYEEIDVDYSETFLINSVTATRQDGPTQTASDTASIAAYDEFGESITDLPLTSDADALAIAQALVAARKDPQLRVLSLAVNTADPDNAGAVLALDIGDRIEVRRSPPGGGARIIEDLFVQHVSISADARSPVWRVVLGVSPL